ncbi:MAG: KpsF/GutQ family sugar-phosphate isomerase [Cellvibrionales bacterium]|nr:KpsF/GutQ family sugar-phosphate isomerase [Cellvibrionales bacterium]
MAESLIASAKNTLTTEASAIKALADTIDQSFVRACELMMSSEGRVIVTGMGKSGHVGTKIAATLASTGTPSFFVHPGEASHGDLGMITPKDVVLALSNSGTTAEVLTIVPLIKRMGAKLISMTGNPESPLALEAEVHLNVSVEREACPLDLAPTTSTTVALAMGDALAVAILDAKGFTAEDFAFSHPGGALGRRLLLRVFDLMSTGDDIPKVSEDSLTKEALMEMSSKGLGMTCVINIKGKLSGIFTDGDLRRCLDSDTNITSAPITSVMTRNGKTISQNILAAEALNIMEDAAITAIVIVDSNQMPIGVIHLHDLLKAGVA